MRAVITCEECGHRQIVARKFYHSEEIFIICHECELPIHSTLLMDDEPEPEEDFPKEVIPIPDWYARTFDRQPHKRKVLKADTIET